MAFNTTKIKFYETNEEETARLLDAGSASERTLARQSVTNEHPTEKQVLEFDHDDQGLVVVVLLGYRADPEHAQQALPHTRTGNWEALVLDSEHAHLVVGQRLEISEARARRGVRVIDEQTLLGLPVRPPVPGKRTPYEERMLSNAPATSTFGTLHALPVINDVPAIHQVIDLVTINARESERRILGVPVDDHRFLIVASTHPRYPVGGYGLSVHNAELRRSPVLDLRVGR